MQRSASQTADTGRVSAEPARRILLFAAVALPVGCAPAARDAASAAAITAATDVVRTPLAGSWRVSVAGMDGQRGILRIGSTGNAIGLVYAKRSATLQPVVGGLDKDGRLRFGLMAGTDRFADPGFVETANATASMNGTWDSGAVTPQGGWYGAGHGTWSATRIAGAGNAAQPIDAKAAPAPQGDPPSVACTQTDAKGHVVRVDLSGASVKSFALHGKLGTALLVTATDGDAFVSLAFTVSASAQPRHLDFTGQEFRRNDIGFARMSGGATGADPEKYQAATGLSPGWLTLTTEPAPQPGFVRFRGTEAMTIARSIEPVAHGDGYDFVPREVSHVVCSVVVDANPQAQNLSPQERLNQAAQNLH